jgi:hypothetical protein
MTSITGRVAGGKRAVTRWRGGVGGGVAGRTAGELSRHLGREEVGIFGQLAGRCGFEWYLDQLSGDHARPWATILAVAASRAPWAEGVLAGFEELASNIAWRSTTCSRRAA